MENAILEPPTKRAVTLPERLESERILTAHQAAELLSISIATFRRQHWRGQLPAAIKVGERRLGWRARDLLDMIASRAAAA
jgi:predicted DNA-binding transcriptional regulator AlpA